MFGTAIRYMAKKPKPKMKPIELKTPPEQTQTITRAIFDIVKEHGPLTIADTWDHVKYILFAKEYANDTNVFDCKATKELQRNASCEVGLRGLTSKRHMKMVLRWMRERQKLRQICNHVGPNKQFLYTTWFTKPNIKQAKIVNDSSQQKFP